MQNVHTAMHTQKTQ